MDSRPVQGGIYLSHALRDASDTKQRPVIVVSPNARNDWASTVIVVPLTTDNIAASWRVPVTCPGLATESYAMCDRLTTIAAKRLLRYLGSTTPSKLQAIQVGILIALGMR